ncbi:MAG: NapC/NirT family cytochrome c [Firmicutes bacterium]|nr:NapC/NirT family cytochrome c [Bacillota bacterium]
MLAKLYLLATHLYISGFAQVDSESLFGRLTKYFSNWDKLKSTLVKLLNQVVLILRNPRRFPRESVIIISAIVLTLIVAILFILIIFSIKKQYEIHKAARSVNRAIPKEEIIRRFTIASISLIVFLAIVNVAASQPVLCAKCHSIEKSHAEWQKSTHKDVGCLSCHYEPGIFGYITGNITGAEHLIAYFFKGGEPSPAVVTNSSCLQCHNDIFNRTVKSKQEVMVRHKDLITGGFSCTGCHPDVAHKTQTAKLFAMNSCTGCHNNKIASAKCDTCHKQDIAYKENRMLDDWPKVKTIRITCTGCHQPATTQGCVKCHGLTLPHSAEFKKHHPMQAEKLNGLCYKCHWESMSENRMCGCHSEGEIHGLPDKWYYEHQKVAKSNGAGCNCHALDFCGRCHDNPEKVYPMGYAGGEGAFSMHSGWNTGMR